MPNLATQTTPSGVPAGALPEAAGSAAGLLAGLRASRAGAAPLAALPPDDYARTHAAFELLSDQRGVIAAHLGGRLALREGPVSVLAVGCGDGTLDAPLAEGLVDARPARPVRYVGVDPWAGSTAAFAAAMGALGRDGLHAEVHTTTFEALPDVGEFDVVTFVHSAYYVRDLVETFRAAHDRLRPGGELLVLSAPRAALNALVEVLAPPVEGHDQWFSDDVAAALENAGLVVESVEHLEAGLDAAAADDEVLDFTVQARLTPDLRPPVRAYLDAVSVPVEGPRRRVPHPVDAYRVVRADPGAGAGA